MDTTSDLLLQFPLEGPVDALLPARSVTIAPASGGPSTHVVDRRRDDRLPAEGHARVVAAAFGGGAAVGATVMWLVGAVPGPVRASDSGAVQLSAGAQMPDATEPEPPPEDVAAIDILAPVASPISRPKRPARPTSKPVHAESTAITVTSAPPGAQVTIDGIGWGRTPVTIHHLPSGQKVIRVTKEGYETQQRTIRVPDDRPSAAVDVTLRPRSAQLKAPRAAANTAGR
jgi:hypothetical protein